MSLVAGHPEIARHTAVLDELGELAERALADGRPDLAAVLVQSAAGVCALRHPGRFADERLEAVLAGCAASLPEVPWTGGEGVLHVLSNTSQVGGQTRLAWRWMERDGARRHSFVVPRPGGPAPGALVRAAAATGGVEHHVPGFEAGLLATAAALRELGARHDLVVLHVQPNDPIASLAFAGLGDRAPILFCNHADHCFWLGRDCADVVVDHRPVAGELAVERRGVPAARTATLPLPLEPVDVTTQEARAAARQRLGVSEATRIVLTIGSAYKYESGDRHLLDVLEPFVAADPATLLVAVGPTATGRWAEATAATGGRVVAAGVLGDLDDLLRASDVLVEAYPCSSGTAAVEAAQTGLPVVAWAPDAEEAALLGSAGAAAGLWPVLETGEELCELLALLLGDREAARAAGELAREAVAAHHDPDAWRAALSAAEAAARSLGPVAPSELATPPETLTATDVVLHHLHARTGHCQPLEIVDRWVAQARALVAWPEVERCFVPSLAGLSTHLELVRCYETALADPGPGEEATAVDALRTLVRAGIAVRGVVTLHPDRVAEAVPALEAALAAGADVDLDVTPTTDPASLLGASHLAIRTPADRLGPPRPHQLGTVPTGS